MKILVLFFLLSAADHVYGSEMQSLDFLAGNCWAGEFADGQLDTHCYVWVYGQNFLRDKHTVVRGEEPYEGETIYRLDAADVIRWVYFASNGGWSEGTATPDGKTMIFPEEIWEGDNGQKRFFRTLWTDISENGYSSVTEEKLDGVWKESWSIQYNRIAR